MKERKGIYFGANITGAEGGASVNSPTMLVCDVSKKGKIEIVVVDTNGAVKVGDNNCYLRAELVDLGKKGVEVYMVNHDSLVLKPGNKEDVEVGPHKVTIEGTGHKGISFKGTVPNIMTPKLSSARYPR